MLLLRQNGIIWFEAIFLAEFLITDRSLGQPRLTQSMDGDNQSVPVSQVRHTESSIGEADRRDAKIELKQRATCTWMSS